MDGNGPATPPISLCLLMGLWLPVSVCTAGPHDVFLKGPWEVMAKLGLEGDIFHFPINIEDQNSVQKLDLTLPVKGTPIKVTFKQYIPDLGWETRCVPQKDGGCVASLTIKGPDLDQAVWLDSRDTEKHIVSSPVGGVELKELVDSDQYATLLRDIVHPEAVGILQIGNKDVQQRKEYVVRSGSVISLDQPKSRLTVLQYLPHYSVDKVTGKVVNLTDEPVNPAIRIRAEMNGRTWERWVWARFAESPHQTIDFPFPVFFSNYHLSRDRQGKYYLITAKGLEPQLLFYKDGMPELEAVQLGQVYPFANKAYGFILHEIRCEAQVKTIWTNRSSRLLRPALVAVMKTDMIEQEIVLEFNQPYHYKTEQGTLVLVYRRSMTD